MKNLLHIPSALYVKGWVIRRLLENPDETIESLFEYEDKYDVEIVKCVSQSDFVLIWHNSRPDSVHLLPFHKEHFEIVDVDDV